MVQNPALMIEETTEKLDLRRTGAKPLHPPFAVALAIIGPASNACEGEDHAARLVRLAPAPAVEHENFACSAAAPIGTVEHPLEAIRIPPKARPLAATAPA
jgi:hypothetical protein